MEPLLIKDLGVIYPTKNSTQKERMGIYLCPLCNSEWRSRTTQIRNGYVSNCKSCSSAIISTIHGMSKTPIYKVWRNIKSRCFNPKLESFINYGGRGITVCEEWINDFTIFHKWALANGYNKNLSIDRINNDGNYEPSNCRWVTRTIQQQNTRKLRKSNKSGYRGVSLRSDTLKWRSTITVNYKHIIIGNYKCRLQAAYAYDKYVFDNKLNNTKNFI